MKDYVKAIGQIVIGVVAGSAVSKGVDVLTEKAKKVVKKKNGKALN